MKLTRIVAYILLIGLFTFCISTMWVGASWLFLNKYPDFDAIDGFIAGLLACMSTANIYRIQEKYEQARKRCTHRVNSNRYR